MEDDEGPGAGNSLEPLSFTQASNGRLYLNIEPYSINPDDIEETSIAFREMYQNFRDAIVTSNRIPYRNLETDWKATTRNEYYTSTIAFFNRDPDVKKYYTLNSNQKRYYTLGEDDDRMFYGFIQFRRKQNANLGEVVLVNFGATLTEKSFRLWASTKEKPENTLQAQAGQYGEGLKTAVRIFCGANFSVVIMSDCRNFKFKEHDSKGLFLSWTTPRKLVQSHRYAWNAATATGEKQRNQFEVHQWEDVAVKIGSEKMGPSNVPSEKISEETFRQWLKITCDIQDSKNKISTDFGDLFWDPIYKGCAFLKGLKLERSAFGNKSFHYGYNLHVGNIGREREALKSARQEAHILQSIWGQAIAQWSASSDALANGNTLTTNPSIDPRKMLVDLFRNKPESADVAMAAEFMEEKTAIAIWNYLLQEATLEKKFYLEEGDETGANIVVEELQRTPETLNKELWKILRKKARKARSPQEEREYLFEKGKRIAILDLPPFGMQVLYVLRVLLNFAFRVEIARSSHEGRLKLVPVEATGLDIHFLYRAEQGNLWINYKKCLDQEEAHRHDVSCIRHTNKNLEGDTFVCDHHVMELFVEATEAISQASDVPITCRHAARETHIASLRLSSMPRFICCETTNNAKELKVSWKANERSFEKELRGGTIEYLVQVHSTRCSQMNGKLITPSDVDRQVSSQNQVLRCACGGQAKVARSDESFKIFSDLGLVESYYGLVRIKESESITGMSFRHQKPLAEDIVVEALLGEDAAIVEPQPSTAQATRSARPSSASLLPDRSISPGEDDTTSGEELMDVEDEPEKDEVWQMKREVDIRKLLAMTGEHRCSFFEACSSTGAEKEALLVVVPNQSLPPNASYIYNPDTESVDSGRAKKRTRTIRDI